MSKNSTKILKQLMNVIIEEAEHNESFLRKVEQIFEENVIIKNCDNSKKAKEVRRPLNRRDPAVFDPVALISEDENLLIEKLQELTDVQLKDIIADYGMDPSKLAMKWKDRERLINHIIDVARRRASKGDVFRENMGNNNVNK